MEIKHADINNFDSLTSNGLVLVDFFANWCGPCRMLVTQLEQLSEQRSEVQIVKVDVDQNDVLAKKFGVMSIPALFLFKDGNVIDNKIGYMSGADIIEWIENNK